jgi:N-acetyl-beta-hexosaminidase
MLSCKQEAPLNYQVIPTPQSVAYKTGHLDLPSEVKIAFPESVKKEADVLQEILSSDFNCRTILDPQNTMADIQLELTTGQSEKEKDGYSIDVSSKGIKITSELPLVSFTASKP